jgi:hypothetical protein
MMGNTQIDSRMDVPMLVSCSHWHVLKMDIKRESLLGKLRETTIRQLNSVADEASGYNSRWEMR